MCSFILTFYRGYLIVWGKVFRSLVVWSRGFHPDISKKVDALSQSLVSDTVSLMQIEAGVPEILPILKTSHREGKGQVAEMFLSIINQPKGVRKDDDTEQQPKFWGFLAFNYWVQFFKISSYWKRCLFTKNNSSSIWIKCRLSYGIAVWFHWCPTQD